MKYVLSKRSLDNLKGVHPNLSLIIQEAITTSTVDFTVVEGVRTLKRQQELYSQGRTKPGKKVTNADGINRKSNHQIKSNGYGYAVDIYPFFLGQVQINHEDTISSLKKIADHIKITAKRLGIFITWGGDWRNPYDPPHFELK